MKRARFEAIFETLSSRLIQFQPGDLFCLEEISFAIAELDQLSPLPEISAPSFALLRRMCGLELRGRLGRNFTAAMSEGLDLLHSVFVEAPLLLKANAPVPEYLVDALHHFEHTQALPDEEPALPEMPAADIPQALAGAAASGPSTGPKLSAEINQSQIMQTFLHDARERLELAQNRVLDLEKPGDQSAALNELFRVFHTFKGETGFLHLPHLGELAHHFENVLDHLRNKRLELQVETIDLLLEGIDAARAIVTSLAGAAGVEGDGNLVALLVPRITRLLKGDAEPLGSRLVKQGIINEEQVKQILQQQKETGFVKKFGEIAIAEGMLPAEPIQQILEERQVFKPVPIPVPTAAEASKSTLPVDKPGIPGESMVKVHASQIQYLVDMLGELLISLNQLDDEDRRVQAGRKIAKNLQLAAMQIGTVGIGNLFSTMRRVVRETCRQVGKDAELLTGGDDLEVDRNLVDKLGEPLMHLLRNAIGHGIEDAAGRAAAGKGPKGQVSLFAERTGHNVVIRVRDDGRGLDQERILAKALEKGLVSSERAALMGRLEIFELIFLPGFSTAERVDAVSGRGVGMDVVKTMVENMRGRLGLESQPGKYTEVSLTFPINMAIIDGMIIQLGPRLFIIPVAVIIESLELDPASFHELSDGVNVCSLRGETIPVIDLGLWFGLARPASTERTLAVVVEARGGKYALLVHDIVAKKEVVIKSLGRLFVQTRGIASGTILQGGRIGLVLDVDQIVRSD